MYMSWGFFYFKELKCNQRILLHHFFNWISQFHPLDVFLLTLPTIQYLKLFSFVLCQNEHQQERCTCPVVQRFIIIHSASLLKILYSDLSIWKRDWTQTFSTFSFKESPLKSFFICCRYLLSCFLLFKKVII